MSREDYQKRTLSIARGEYKPMRGEPKVFFSSLKSLSEVLSDKNRELLRIIVEHEPKTLAELSELSGRQPSNISRTLKTLEAYGIVETKKTSRSKRPIVKALDFDIQLSAC
jgi:predicted transcriptional regulator